MKSKNLNLHEAEVFDRQNLFVLLDSIPIAALIADSSGIVIYANRLSEKFLNNGQELNGVSIDNFTGDKINQKKHAALREEYQRTPTKRDMSNSKVLSIKLAEGAAHVKIFLFPVVFSDRPDEKLTMAFISDYTSEVSAIMNLKQRNEFDSLTGLFSRDHMLSKFLNYVDCDKPKCIVCIGIESLSSINDNYGFEIGDLFLRSFSQELKKLISEEDYFCRLYGDVFLMILHDDWTSKSIEKFDRIKCAIENPKTIECANLNVNLTANAGYVIIPDDCESIRDGIKLSELALMQSKDSPLPIRRFDALSVKLLRRNRFLAKKLAGKSIVNELTLNFQPKFIASTLQYYGSEVLLRWRDGDSFISPAEFIPIAEETGSILHIGRWVIEETCKIMHQWGVEYLPHGKMAINLSAKQLRDKTLIDFVEKCLEKYKIAPSLLEFELTESAAMQSVAATKEAFNRLHEIGISVAIDDFGTGYSSMSRIATMPIDTLKLDKSFVAEIGNHTGDEICNSIISLAKSLKINCVAEGVENEFQLEWLRAKGCNQIQGFFLSKPLDRIGIKKYLININMNKT